MAEETKNADKPVTKAPATTSAARSTKRQRVADDGPAYTGTPLSMAGIRGLVANSVMWKIVMGLLIFIFAVGFAITAIAPKSGPQAGQGSASGGPSRVALVGNQVVERANYVRVAKAQIDQMAQFGMKTSTTDLLGSYQRGLDNLISDAAQYDEAIAKGMTPTAAEIDADIDKKVQDALKNEGGDAAGRRRIEAKFGSMKEFESKVRENYQESREGIAHQLAVDKLKKSIEDANKTTEADYKRSVTKLDLYQITVRPKPEPVLPGQDANKMQEKSTADAKARAVKLAETLKNADLATFKTTAKKESDDYATKDKGGSLGWTMPDQANVSQPVKDALQASSGKLIGPLEDFNSWVIFYVNGRKEELPKDYAKNKTQTLKDYETRKDNDAWTKYLDDLKKQKTPEILDPAMSAYKIQNEKIYSAPPEEQKKLRQEALDKYKEALTYTTPEESAAIQYQMATLYRQNDQKDQYVTALQQAVKHSEDPTIRVQLATALHEVKRDKEAMDELQKASDGLTKNPSAPSPFGGGSPDASTRMQIAAAYEAMGKKDLAAAERKKIPAPPPGAPNMGGLGSLGGVNSPPITIKR